MKRVILAVTLSILLVLSMGLPVQAAEGALVVDDAGLFAPEAQSALARKAQSLQLQYGWDIAILTVPALYGSSAADYADQYYFSHYGEDGLLLLLAMEEREWYFYTCGDAMYAFTDYGIQQLGNTALPYWQEGWYFDGFSAVLDQIPDYMDAYLGGAPIDRYVTVSETDYAGESDDTVYYQAGSSVNLLLSLGIGLLCAAVTVLVMRSSMNTKRPQHGAGSYLTEGSFRLNTCQDLFLYSNISKVRRQENTGSKSGGGSSVHRSSGGRSHGGGGGKF